MTETWEARRSELLGQLEMLRQEESSVDRERVGLRMKRCALERERVLFELRGQEKQRELRCGLMAARRLELDLVEERLKGNEKATKRSKALLEVLKDGPTSTLGLRLRQKEMGARSRRRNYVADQYRQRAEELVKARDDTIATRTRECAALDAETADAASKRANIAAELETMSNFSTQKVNFMIEELLMSPAKDGDNGRRALEDYVRLRAPADLDASPRTNAAFVEQSMFATPRVDALLLEGEKEDDADRRAAIRDDFKRLAGDDWRLLQEERDRLVEALRKREELAQIARERQEKENFERETTLSASNLVEELLEEFATDVAAQLVTKRNDVALEVHNFLIDSCYRDKVTPSERAHLLRQLDAAGQARHDLLKSGVASRLRGASATETWLDADSRTRLLDAASFSSFSDDGNTDIDESLPTARAFAAARRILLVTENAEDRSTTLRCAHRTGSKVVIVAAGMVSGAVCVWAHRERSVARLDDDFDKPERLQGARVLAAKKAIRNVDFDASARFLCALDDAGGLGSYECETSAGRLLQVVLSEAGPRLDGDLLQRHLQSLRDDDNNKKGLKDDSGDKNSKRNMIVAPRRASYALHDPTSISSSTQQRLTIAGDGGAVYVISYKKKKDEEEINKMPSSSGNKKTWFKKQQRGSSKQLAALELEEEQAVRFRSSQQYHLAHHKTTVLCMTLVEVSEKRLYLCTVDQAGDVATWDVSSRSVDGEQELSARERAARKIGTRPDATARLSFGASRYEPLSEADCRVEVFSRHVLQLARSSEEHQLAMVQAAEVGLSSNSLERVAAWQCPGYLDAQSQCGYVKRDDDDDDDDNDKKKDTSSEPGSKKKKTRTLLEATFDRQGRLERLVEQECYERVAPSRLLAAERDPRRPAVYVLERRSSFHASAPDDNEETKTARTRLLGKDTLIAHYVSLDERGIPTLEPMRSVAHDVAHFGGTGARLERCSFAVTHGGRGRAFVLFRIADLLVAYDATHPTSGPVAKIPLGRSGRGPSHLAAAHQSFVVDDAQGLWLFDLGEVRNRTDRRRRCEDVAKDEVAISSAATTEEEKSLLLKGDSEPSSVFDEGKKHLISADDLLANRTRRSP